MTEACGRKITSKLTGQVKMAFLVQAGCAVLVPAGPGVSDAVAPASSKTIISIHQLLLNIHQLVRAPNQWGSEPAGG